MSTSKTSILRECCDNTKSYLIIYDGADTGDLTVLVCGNCIVKTIFQKFIKIKKEIQNISDVTSILENLGA